MTAKIKPGMDFDAWREAWFSLARERGHILKTDANFGEIDQFVTYGGYCNGPGCAKCGWTECMHCDWKGEKIPQCTGADESSAP